MAKDPLDKVKNRGQQIAVDEKFGITLYDIDYAMMEYMTDVVIPDVDENGTKKNGSKDEHRTKTLSKMISSNEILTLTS